MQSLTESAGGASNDSPANTVAPTDTDQSRTPAEREQRDSQEPQHECACHNRMLERSRSFRITENCVTIALALVSVTVKLERHQRVHRAQPTAAVRVQPVEQGSNCNRR